MRGRSILFVPVALTVLPLALIAQTASEFTHERQVVTVGAGPQRLPIDEALLIGGTPFRVSRRGETLVAEGGLSDLRLFAEGGRPVPYLLIQPATGEPEWISGGILSVAATKKTSGFEVDLDAPYSIDLIRVEGLPVPYLKRLTLEGSGDRERWTLLAAEGTLFDLPDEGLQQNAIGFTSGRYRYFRVTWNDTNSGRVPLPRAVLARRVASLPPPAPTTIRAALERRASEPGVSRYRVRLAAAALPIVALDLDVGGGHVYRRAVVSESRFSGTEAAPVELGRATLARVTRDGVTASSLRIPVSAPSEAELELVIDDAANPPLEVRGVSVVLAQLPWVYFEAPVGPVVGRYGSRMLQKPVYDLEAVRDSVELAKIPEGKWGSVTERMKTEHAAGTPPSLLPNAGPALDPSRFQYARAIQPASAGLVVLPLDAHALALGRGVNGRFADARVLDGSNSQIPYLLERRDEPLSIDLPMKPASDSQAAELKASGGRQRSVYVLTLPYVHMPPATLVLETSARVFQRTVRVGVERLPDRHRRDAWFDEMAVQTWRHADDQTPARALSLRLGTTGETELRLAVDEGDNAPLPITAARLLLPSFRLRFYHPAEGSLRLVYGRNDLQAPQYDLALLAPQVMGAVAGEVTASAVSGAAPAPPAAFVSPTAFWAFLGAAVLVLLVLIVRLVRNQGAPATEPRVQHEAHEAHEDHEET